MFLTAVRTWQIQRFTYPSLPYQKQILQLYFYTLILIYIFKEWSYPFKVLNPWPPLEVYEEVIFFALMPIFTNAVDTVKL